MTKEELVQEIDNQVENTYQFDKLEPQIHFIVRHRDEYVDIIIYFTEERYASHKEAVSKQITLDLDSVLDEINHGKSLLSICLNTIVENKESIF